VSLALGADASFVARTIDSDRRHLTSVLRAAADHQGAAFIEIYQNCPIFNDDAFAPLKDASAADQRLVKLEHGEPVRFAGGSRGLRFGPQGQLEAVEVAAAEGPGKSDAAAAGPGKSDAAADESTLITHDAHRADPSYAFALSRLDASDFRHTPVGVFRQVEQPSYDQLMAEQIEAAKQRSGPGDLAALLAGNDTWEVN
jgi:2-oxoglutarate ferredoxin oxidoreductase subunit beta